MIRLSIDLDHPTRGLGTLSEGTPRKMVNMDGANRQDCSGTVAWTVVGFRCNRTEGRRRWNLPANEP
jgi:hypothetical protein